jgi:hypothetical protein
LKILKVLNYICKNIQLMSSQGIRFMLSSTADEESKDAGFADIDLQIALSQIHPSLFHQ